MKKIFFFFLIIGSCVFLFTSSKKADNEAKMNGVCFVAPRVEVTDAVLDPIVGINANWLAIVPYGYVRPSSPTVHFNSIRQHWGETVKGSRKTIEYAQSKGLKIMLKPHIWVIGQGWAGDFELTTEEEWQTWEKGYRKYILTYAEMAEELSVPLFCVGTEFRKAVVQRGQFWKKLISEVRELYSGKITYAANWDNYMNVPFWEDIDYIGIDAYFPLSADKTPTLNTIKGSWQPIKNDLAALSKKFDKKIVFTEFGYESKDYNTDGHWKYNKDTLKVNLEAQAIAYQGILSSFWNEPWFAGGFLWKWHSNHNTIGGESCKRYTPQNKPAADVLNEFFRTYN